MMDREKLRAVISPKATPEALKEITKGIKAAGEGTTDPEHMASMSLRAALFEPFANWMSTYRPTHTEMLQATIDIAALIVGSGINSCRIPPGNNQTPTEENMTRLPPERRIELILYALKGFTDALNTIAGGGLKQEDIARAVRKFRDGEED